jgi:hypothetical protein
MLPRVSIGAVRIAHLNIFLSSTSARANTGSPPYIYKRAFPKQPNITLPYNSVVTAIAYTIYIRTLLLNNPNNLVWHLMLLNAALALLILFSNMAVGAFLSLLIISPKYLNSSTFVRGDPLQ